MGPSHVEKAGFALTRVVPTGTVAITVLVLSDITETVPVLELATKTSPLPES